ncbi:MAG: AmmeMemoRadiSam system protein B [Candidatus Omnitrophica bacterium]|nr:AmmeMemoRadiSam system protein B [Candidatus Omnitrophota bacterium]
MNVRTPAVAGQFYPKNKISLEKQLSELFVYEKELFDAKGAIMPHAGYVYSGPVVANVASQIKPKDFYIVIGPNHTGYGKPFSLMASGIWRTPLGDISIDDKFSDRLLETSRYLKADYQAHIYEHSIEVELPFLQYKNKSFKLVPIVITSATLDTYSTIGRELAECVKEFKVDTTIIASSDFTHYEEHETASRKDKIAIEAILELDEKRFLKAISEYEITACGYAPIAVMLVAVKLLGAKKAHLVKYQTSGNTSGDYESVVGYAGIIIT